MSGGTSAVADRPSHRWVDEVVAVLPAWLTARALLIVAYVVAVAVADRLVPGERPAPLDEGLLAWDGTWYQGIADGGYGASAEALRFFPLYPLLGRGLGLVLAGSTSWALVIVANVASLALAVLLRRLVLTEGRSRAVADRAVWLSTLFPSAFVLGWAYSEALMLVGAVGMFLALRRHAWWWAALAGAVAAGSRPLGVLLVIPAVVEVLRWWRAGGRPPGGGAGREVVGERVAAIAAIVAPIVATAAYLWWAQVAHGDAWAPFTVQGDLRGEGIDPLRRMAEGVSQLVGPERFGDGLHLPFALGFVVLLVLTFRWWPVSYGLFAGAVLVVSLSAENLNSLERYGLNAFPLVLTLALLASDERVERPVLALSAAAFTGLASLAWLGAYVP